MSEENKMIPVSIGDDVVAFAKMESDLHYRIEKQVSTSEHTLTIKWIEVEDEK